MNAWKQEEKVASAETVGRGRVKSAEGDCDFRGTVLVGGLGRGNEDAKGFVETEGRVGCASVGALRRVRVGRDGCAIEGTEDVVDLGRCRRFSRLKGRKWWSRGGRDKGEGSRSSCLFTVGDVALGAEGGSGFRGKCEMVEV